MTYLDDNLDPGQDIDLFERTIQIEANGHKKLDLTLKKMEYCYKDNLALLVYNGIKPGDIEIKRLGIFLYPKDIRGGGFLVYDYLRYDKLDKQEDAWMWDSKLRRAHRYTAQVKEDGFLGSDMTMDDFYWREPWEENHGILGEDKIEGQECLVIESKNRDPGYYLTKRITWLEKQYFLDLHEEQFDKNGRLFKLIDKGWKRVKPWNYWVRWQLNFVHLDSKHRTLYQTFDWIFDQGLDDDEFSTDAMKRERFWRQPENIPPMGLPPEPQIRWEFWHRIGDKPIVIK